MLSVHGGVSLLRNSLRPPAYTLARRYATEVARGSESLNSKEELYKTYKPKTPGLRHLVRPLNSHLWAGRPIRDLTVPLRKSSGRNNTGQITVRHRGGGHKRRLRLVDFLRMDPGPQDVVRIEYDPNRSAHIALIKNRDPNVHGLKKWSYILATEGMRAGDVVQSFRQGIPDGFLPDYQGATEGGQQGGSSSSYSVGLLRARTLKPGNVLPLHLIPEGTIISSISLQTNGRGILVRSAGSFGQLVAHEADGKKYSHVKLQSGEVRKVFKTCCATIGQVSNVLWRNRKLGKAGRSRWLGIRPTVRGTAMNRCDHPHGGGRGKSKGNKHPRSIWGWNTKGKRTRRPGPKGPKNSNKMVIHERRKRTDK